MFAPCGLVMMAKPRGHENEATLWADMLLMMSATSEAAGGIIFQSQSTVNS